MCFSMLQKLLWKKGKICSTCPEPTCFCYSWHSAKGRGESRSILRQAETMAAPTALWAAAVPTTSPHAAYSVRIYKYTLKCLPGWGPACLSSSWSPPTWAIWPVGPCKHGALFPGLPIQPFLLICPRLEPRPFPQHDGFAHGPSLVSSCPADMVWKDLSLALCTASKCRPRWPTDLKVFLLMQAGALKPSGLLAEVRHQDLALRTDICKSVFLFLLPLCFSNKDKAARKKGTWNSVKNTQKSSTNLQITNKTNKK